MSVLGLVVMQGGLTLTLGKPRGILNQPVILKVPVTINGQSEVLPIKSVRNSVYHPQTGRLVER